MTLNSAALSLSDKTLRCTCSSSTIRMVRCMLRLYLLHQKTDIFDSTVLSMHNLSGSSNFRYAPKMKGSWMRLDVRITVIERAKGLIQKGWSQGAAARLSSDEICSLVNLKAAKFSLV